MKVTKTAAKQQPKSEDLFDAYTVLLDFYLKNLPKGKARKKVAQAILAVSDSVVALRELNQLFIDFVKRQQQPEPKPVYVDDIDINYSNN